MKSTLKVLTDIIIYPIKSLAGIHLHSASMTSKGLSGDRIMMLIDEKNLFISQRTHPKLSLLRVTMSDNKLKISQPNNLSTIELDLENVATIFDSEKKMVQIWEDFVWANGINDPTIDNWFSKYLGIKCSLVFMSQTAPKRFIDANYRYEGSWEEDVSFADGFPVLIIGEESLNDLNQRLPNSVSMHRFRPNLVFEGGMAYEEDHWHEIKIGNTSFLGVKPCSRCIITTLEETKGEFQKEPLRTLASYRKKQNNKIYFGQNLLIGSNSESLQKVTIGDSVAVKSHLLDFQMPWENI